MDLTNAADDGGANCDGAVFTGCRASLELDTVKVVDIDNLDLSGSDEHGIFGSSVTDFDLSNSSVANAGDAAHEHGIFFANLLGTSAAGTGSSITGSTITNSGNHNMFVRNTVATGGGNPDLLQISTTFFTNLLLANPNQAAGLVVNSRDNADMRLEVLGDSDDFTVEFQSLVSGGIVLNGDGGDLESLIQNTTFGPGAGNLGGGISSILTQDSNHDFTFNNNLITMNATGAVEPAAIRVSAFDTGIFDGDATTSTSTPPTVAGSASSSSRAAPVAVASTRSCRTTTSTSSMSAVSPRRGSGALPVRTFSARRAFSASTSITTTPQSPGSVNTSYCITRRAPSSSTG